MINVLKRVEILLASCSWPVNDFHGRPTATDEAFLSLRKNLEQCVQMMRYYSRVQRITFEKVCTFILKVPNDDSWGRACESDRHLLLQFLSKYFSEMSDWDSHCHWYLGSIAVISKDPKMFSECSDIPFRVVQVDE